MTQVQSNSHRVEVVTGGGGIEAAAAALSANAWGTFTITNQLNCDPNGTGNNMLTFSPKLVVDSARRKIRIAGGEHGSGISVRRHHIGKYDIDADNWVSTTPDEIPVSAGTSGAHMYYAYDVDLATGDIYTFAPYYDMQNLRKLSYAGVWSTPLPANSSFSAHGQPSAAYHPGLYSSGGMVVCSNSGIWTIDIRAGSPTWNLILDLGGVGTAAFPAAGYDPVLGYVITGGSDGSGTGLFKVTGPGNGTATAIPMPSIGLSPSGGGYLLMSSALGGFPVVLNANTKTVQEFNGSTWANVTTSIPAALFNTQETAGGAFPGVGIVFVEGLDGPIVTATQGRIWKR